MKKFIFASESFVIRYKGECVLLECKATSGNVKSAKTLLKHPEKCHVNSAIKLGDYNVGDSGQIVTLPYISGIFVESAVKKIPCIIIQRNNRPFV